MQLTPNEATQRYLNGIEWPAMQETVIAAMERNGAPSDMIEAVRAYEVQRLVSPGAVETALYRFA